MELDIGWRLPNNPDTLPLESRERLFLYMPSFRKIKRSGNLYEDVVKEIKVAILSGRYGSGAPLPSETQLAEQFGVSRPVVREALRYLQSSGFVEIRRGTKGGAYILDTLRHTFF